MGNIPPDVDAADDQRQGRWKTKWKKVEEGSQRLVTQQFYGDSGATLNSPLTASDVAEVT